jgi:hypothetical protein
MPVRTYVRQLSYLIDLYFINTKTFKVVAIFKYVHPFYFRKCFSNDNKKGIVHCNIETGISVNTGRNIKSLSSTRKICVVVCWIGNVDHNNGKHVMCLLISGSCF